MDADPGSVRLFLPVEAPSEQLSLVKCEVRTDLLAGPMLATVLDDWVEIPSQVKRVKPVARYCARHGGPRGWHTLCLRILRFVPSNYITCMLHG